jgi:hypothetical protein
MKDLGRICCFCIYLGIGLITLSGQTDSTPFVISGYVSDASSGEVLPGATILVQETGQGTSTNGYGYFTLKLIEGNYSLKIEFIGYEPYIDNIILNADIKLNPRLELQSHNIREVEIKSDGREEQRRNPMIGIERLTAATINRIPVLFGETDPLKSLQFFPGISATSEGSSGFSVRGGNPDQNLILFDEAIVYNAGHLLGFFSVFNTDAIKEVQIYKGDLPASAGGRLASMVDIRSRDGNLNKFSGIVSAGLISSRITLDGPIIKNKSSFLISARRTYLDIFLPLSSDEDIRDNRLYFYDINMKGQYILGDDDRIFISVYNGRDVFRTDSWAMNFGNRTISLRWNRLFSQLLFSNLTIVNSRYDYYLGTWGEEFQSIEWLSKLNDYSLKYAFSWFPDPENKVDFGYQSIFHSIMPGNVSSTEEDATLLNIKIPTAHSMEHGLYINHTKQAGNGWIFRYGLRYSLFQNIGLGRAFNLNESFVITDTISYRKGKIYNTYGGIEPRIGVTKLLSDRISVKGSFARTRQYIHLASNSTSSTPLDVWFTSSPNIPPQIANQLSAGVFYKSIDHKWEHSAEIYAKRIKQTIDFKDHPNLILNEALEAEVRPGKASANGMELMTRYSDKQFYGWISYTLAKSVRQSEWINNGKQYLSSYDHTHDLSIVLNYKFNDRIDISGNWVFFTGAPVTLPVGRFDFQGGVVPIYSERNAERMPEYHRMDISITIKNRNNHLKKLAGEWNFSIYNLYGKKNAWIINFTGDDYKDTFTKWAEKTYLFSIVPSVSYTVKF